MMKRNHFIIVGIAVALLIAILAPFLASGNPDGLESAFFGIYGAKEVQGEKLDDEQASLAEEQVVVKTGNTFEFQSPLPDYSVPGLEKPGEVIAVVAGTLIVLAAGFGISRFVSGTK
jgi:cobalt/nickel transport protein